MFDGLRRNAGRLLLAGGILALTLVPAATAMASNPDPNTLDIDGSTTVYPVVRMSQTQFPIDFSGTVMNVTATGSGHGQISILNGYVDIAMSSSGCGTANQFVPTSGGFTAGGYTLSTNPSPYTCAQLTDSVVARDGLSITINKSKLTECGLSSMDITKAQIVSIWTGAITNWNQLNPACPSKTLTPRARIIGSGTRQSLCDMAPFSCTTTTPGSEQATIAATGLSRLVENADLEAAIAANPDQIGYGGMINVDPNVTAMTVGGIVVNPTTVSNGTYPLSRNLHLFTLPTTVNAKQRIADFTNWMLNPKGQGAFANEGYVAVGSSAPNWDVNVDNRCSVLDLTSIGAYWGQKGPLTGDAAPLPVYVRGWVRSDVNFDGQVSVLDLTTVGGHWGQTW
jgi:phosphate transport system substrate-binding protein